jgi:membrane-associated phospholipid phosphatase
MSKQITQWEIKLFPILFFLLCSLAQVKGQNDIPSYSDDDETKWQSFTYDMASVLGGVGYSYSRPLHWKGKDWKTLGAVTAGTGVLYLIDDDTSDFFSRQKESIPKFIRDYGSEFGSPEYNYMFTGGVYFAGLFTKDEKLRRTGVLLIASATSAGLLQQVTKSLIGRARPVGGKTKDTFDPFNPSRNFHSFPSGHTILAFTNAYAIAKQFKNPWTKAGIYTVGLIPGVSRIWDGQHWLTDVVLGVAISIFTVESIDRYLDGRYDEKYNNQTKKVSWNLDFGPGKIGVVAHF